MNVQIKNYKRFAGHDGQGFDASLYIDGVRSAIISDNGWGGGWEWNILQPEKVEVLKEKCDALPPTTFSDFALDMDVDLWVEENLLQFADMKKSCGGKITFFKDGKFYTVGNHKYNAKQRINIEKQIRDVHPTAILVNGMKIVATI